MNVLQERRAGYAHLICKYAITAPALLHTSRIADISVRRVVTLGGLVDETFPESYAPDDFDFDHLVFALKYDGVDLAVLKRLFRCVDRGELEHRIAAQPTSKYARRIFFFFEFLTGECLALNDLKKGPYCQLLEPDEYFVSASRPAPRYRVHDNLLGDAGFCPVVRRTPLLTAMSGKDLGGRAHEITSAVEPLLLTRALSYLYTKETRSSFAIEREEIGPGERLERFIGQLAAAGTPPLEGEIELTELQNAFVDPRYVERGFRRAGDLEVYVGETLGFRERVHHIGARSASTPDLMAAWARMRPVEGPGGPVVEAACRAFSFVFIHPFGDGNGRIHRLLLHSVLARRKYLPPRLVIPISAVILADPNGYDQALESFSARTLPLIEFKLDDEGVLTVLNDVDDLYRYPDLTVVSEATFGWLERAIEVDLVAELDLLRRFDEIRSRMRKIVEMPDRKEQAFIKVCLANHGKLAARKREYFAELDDRTIAALEAVFAEVLGPTI